MRRMMEAMPGGMPGMGQMDHGSMDHSQMEGMTGEADRAANHSQIASMDHAEGVAMQRRNAGVQNGDERPATPTVGEAEFAASATADRFHTALVAGDRAAVEALLLPDAVVLEGGKAEARAEYLGHHFGSDAAFLAAVEREPLTRKTDVAGDAAWVASTSRISGAYEGRTLDLDSAELLVLRRDASAPDGWRVAAVHWSSTSRE
jgi:ketosteroid isomerase-like protein